MPEYDPTNYPSPMTDDLTSAEVGRDVPGPDPAVWPASNLLPEKYAGPVPAREFETSGGPGPSGRSTRSEPPATTDAGSVMPSIVPPPGHTAQP